MAAEHFDYLVIGGGSGGVSSARRAAGYGAKVALVEKQRMGGTCVNVGCVPKKVMFNAAHVMEAIHDAKHFGITTEGTPAFDWGLLKKRRDALVARLNTIYETNVGKADITLIKGEAKFSGVKEVTVGDKTYTADNILIAVGGAPRYPTIPGAELAITSDEFFELEEQPKRVVVVGGGYIAAELAGIFQALGSETTMFVRRTNGLISAFDPYLRENLETEMRRGGVDLRLGAQPTALARNEDGSINVSVGDETLVADCVLYAIGRVPVTAALDVEKTGLTTTAKGTIETSPDSRTSVDGVFAVGDVLGIADLTPVAIKAGRTLADHLFGGKPSGVVDYENIPTVMFTHPTIGTCGLTEPEAAEKFGADNIHVYTSKFPNLYYGPWEIPRDDKPRTAMKVIVEKSTEKVLGIHIIGMGADEMMQGFGVAMKMGATKADLDSCVAIHPTASEELVTLAPWGMSWKRETTAAGAGAAAL